MDIEKKDIKLLINKTNPFNTELILLEEAPDDEDMVLLEIIIDEQKFSYKSNNFFSALQDMRKDLEKKNIQIICNGTARNVYPSPMQLSMGSGRMAYKLYIGQQAKTVDVIDIFECDERLDFVNIDEQSKFHDEWIKSIVG